MENREHLEFLISQYVDNTLDADARKQVEHLLHTDAQAALCFQHQKEIQDVLQDWGNRIPMINWDDFDRNLANKLADLDVAKSNSVYREKWLKVRWAVAASVVLVVGTAASWNFWTQPIDSHGGTAKVVPNDNPTQQVAIKVNQPQPAGRVEVIVEQPNAVSASVRIALDPNPPENAVRVGVANQGVTTQPGTVTAGVIVDGLEAIR